MAEDIPLILTILTKYIPTGLDAASKALDGLSTKTKKFDYSMLSIMFGMMNLGRTIDRFMRTTWTAFANATDGSNALNNSMAALVGTGEALKVVLFEAFFSPIISYFAANIAWIVGMIFDFLDQHPKLAAMVGNFMVAAIAFAAIAGTLATYKLLFNSINFNAVTGAILILGGALSVITDKKADIEDIGAVFAGLVLLNIAGVSSDLGKISAALTADAWVHGVINVGLLKSSVAALATKMILFAAAAVFITKVLEVLSKQSINTEDALIILASGLTMGAALIGVVSLGYLLLALAALYVVIPLVLVVINTFIILLTSLAEITLVAAEAQMNLTKAFAQWTHNDALVKQCDAYIGALTSLKNTINDVKESAKTSLAAGMSSIMKGSTPGEIIKAMTGYTIVSDIESAVGALTKNGVYSWEDIVSGGVNPLTSTNSSLSTIPVGSTSIAGSSLPNSSMAGSSGVTIVNQISVDSVALGGSSDELQSLMTKCVEDSLNDPDVIEKCSKVVDDWLTTNSSKYSTSAGTGTTG